MKSVMQMVTTISSYVVLFMVLHLMNAPSFLTNCPLIVVLQFCCNKTNQRAAKKFARQRQPRPHREKNSQSKLERSFKLIKVDESVLIRFRSRQSWTRFVGFGVISKLFKNNSLDYNSKLQTKWWWPCYALSCKVCKKYHGSGIRR